MSLADGAAAAFGWYGAMARVIAFLLGTAKVFGRYAGLLITFDLNFGLVYRGGFIVLLWLKLLGISLLATAIENGVAGLDNLLVPLVVVGRRSALVRVYL